MSTQINVTVGSGGLSDKARQLQTAARQAQLEKERQQRLEAQGSEQRNAKLEAEGKARDGSPLYSSGFRQPEIDRRPAANRQGLPSLLFVPNQDFVSDTINARTIAIKNTKFIFDTLGAGNIDQRVLPVFMPSGGPGDAPYLKAADRAPETGTNVSELEYLVCNNLGVIDYVSPVSFFDRKVVTAEGVVDPVQIRRPLQQLNEYTVEFYFQVGGSSSLDSITSSITTSFRPLIPESDPNYADLLGFGISYNPNQSQAGNDHNYALACLGPEGTTINIFFGGSGSLDANQYRWPSPLEAFEWYHFALVKTANTESIFFEGSLIRSVNSDFVKLKNVPSTTIVQTRVLFTNGGVLVFRPGIHGLRFSPRALYNAPFTPPVNLVSFA